MLWSNLVTSQEVNQQVEFRIDNDKLFFVDRYYTNGIFITYKRALNKDFIFDKKEENNLQLNVTFGNETYTPKNLSSFDVNDFDRPFAGWLFAGFELGQIKEHSAFFIGFETGITGKESLSGKLQTTFHNLFRIDDPTWIEEIEFKWLFNIKAHYFLNWQLDTNDSIIFEISPTLGGKDVFIENNVHFYFGRYNNLRNSSRLGIIDKTNKNEFFGNISIGYKYVAHNTLIEGSIVNDDVLFTTDASSNILKLNIGGVLKHNSNTIKLSGNFNSRETPSSTSHIYGSFTYAYKF